MDHGQLQGAERGVAARPTVPALPVGHNCQVGPSGLVVEDSAGIIVVRRRGGRRLLGGPLVFGDCGVFLADAAQDVARRFMTAKLAVQLDCPVGRAGGLERLGGRSQVVELLPVEDPRVVMQTATLERLGGQAVIAQEFPIYVGCASEIAVPDGLFRGLAVLTHQILDEVWPSTPDSDRLAAHRLTQEIQEIVDRAIPWQPIPPSDRPLSGVNPCHREGMPQGGATGLPRETLGAVCGPATSDRSIPTGSSP